MLRITPAYAGKSNPQGLLWTRSWDHPRLRGEKVTHTISEILAARITPAYAGKSCTSQRLPNRGRDHPRLRGEKRSAGKVLLVRGGSPPLTQGKEPPKTDIKFTIGITPAYAGKREYHKSGRIHCQDHPRLRGEKVLILPCLRRQLGSPPLTRGKD